MIGAVIEHVSNWKLLFLISSLLVVQTVFFLLGGLIAPAPSSALEVLFSQCHSLASRRAWYWTRPENSNGCKRLEGGFPYSDVTPNDIVFVAQIPLPRDNVDLAYSPWQSSLLGILMPEVIYHPDWEMGDKPLVKLDVRLGYRNYGDRPDDWKELIHTTISRQLDCSLEDHERSPEQRYNCVPLELFELGSNDYPFYLLNIRIPVYENDSANQDIGRWGDLRLIAIHQNGGFTKVWLSMKTFVTPVTLCALIWYWRRIRALPRPPDLLEVVLFMLGITMTFLNFPVEWLSLWLRMPFMLLFSDIRQGVFYAMLASFWLIFTGEHLKKKNQLSNYWKHLSAVLFGCSCLFIFDMCERGVHLTNPFFSIWATQLGAKLAYGFIVLAAVCACIYLVFLAYLVFRILCTIKRRRANMQQMHYNRRIRFENVIYRFKFLMITTLICAALTVASFIMGQVGEGQLRWGEIEESPRIQYTSAFLTGVYGMWNIYVFLLLALYAPSHKQYDSVQVAPPTEDIDDLGECDEFTEESVLTTFIRATGDAAD